LDVEFLCVWLDKVVLLVHCCVLDISCTQGTTLYSVSCRTLSFSQFQPRMSIILALLSISNVQGADLCLPRKILGPSERGADYRSITYECSGTVVTHDCAPIARISLIHVQTPPRPTPAPSTANRLERGSLGRRRCSDPPPSPVPSPPADEPEAVWLTGGSSPPKKARSPTLADNALVVQCLEKPCKAAL
jgi:hypothetical protein